MSEVIGGDVAVTAVVSHECDDAMAVKMAVLMMRDSIGTDVYVYLSAVYLELEPNLQVTLRALRSAIMHLYKCGCPAAATAATSCRMLTLTHSMRVSRNAMRSAVSTQSDSTSNGQHSKPTHVVPAGY